MNEQRNAAKRAATFGDGKRYPLVAQLIALLVAAVGSAMGIFVLLWVTVLPAFGLLYLLGWLP